MAKEEKSKVGEEEEVKGVDRKEIEGRMEGEELIRMDKGEEMKKRGRPRNIERLTKKRTKSMNSIMDLLGGGIRGKREQDEGEMVVEGEEEIFKRSRLVARSPVKKEVKGRI